MAEIFLPNGDVALVDDADFVTVAPFRWHSTAKGYVCAQIGRRKVGIHNLLMNPRPDQDVHHPSRNALDNRRSNMVLCTKSAHRQLNRLR